MFIFISRVSVLCKGRAVFTREQQASFKAAYEALRVHVPTFRSHGNLKPALVGPCCRLCAEDSWHSKTAFIRAEEEEGIGRKEANRNGFTVLPILGIFYFTLRIKIL